jgi:hypothetical protein
MKRLWFALAGLVVAIAAVVAVSAALIPETEDAEDGDPREPTFVTVIVPIDPIPTKRLLDPLIDQGIFVELTIPRVARIDGAITDVEQLRGRRTTLALPANEQIATHGLSNEIWGPGVV